MRTGLWVGTVGWLLALLASCTRDAGPIVVSLTERIETSEVSRLQLRIDTIDGVVQRRVDSVSENTNLIRLLNNRRISVVIPAADVVLDGDSIRLGIIQSQGTVLVYPESDDPQIGDHLLITTWGNTGIPIAMDMDNVGPIERRTIFRIGRRYYLLRAFDPEGGQLAIEALPPDRSYEAVAEFDPRYRRVPVQTVGGEATYIERTPGRDLLVYFWGYGPRRGEDVALLDSMYLRAPQLRDRLDTYLINRHDGQAFITRFLSENQLTLPIYRATPATCRGLNCRPALPYGVWINGEGRVISYYLNAEAVVRKMQDLAEH